MLLGYGVSLAMLKLQVKHGNTSVVYAEDVDLIGVQGQVNELTRVGGLEELKMFILERLEECANFSSVMSAGSKTSKSRITALSNHLTKSSPLQVVTVHSSDG